MVAKDIAKKIIETFNRGGTIFFCGNGGSATQASHFAAEFLCKYKKIRKPLPAIALNDIAAITAIANDFGYGFVFSRQLEALASPIDLLITLTTSGRSPNVLRAIETGTLKGMNVLEFPYKGHDSGDIQNKQVKLMHEVVEIVEEYYDNKHSTS